jgi:Tol biopolymer transport system component
MEAPIPHKSQHLIIWIFFFVLTTLACAAISGGISTTTSTSLIAYIGTDGNLYTINQNGDNNLPVTKNAHIQPGLQAYQHPTWSPDGRHLAFVSIDLSDNSQMMRLLVYTPETRETKEIFSDKEEAPFYLYWSPDNDTISFLTSDPSSPGLSLRLAFLNGNPPRVADIGQPYYWVWSPDGKEIFVHKGGSKSANPNAQLGRFFSEDGKVQTFDLAPGIFQAPAWSLDGKQLLAAIEVEQQNTLSLLDRDGTITKALTEYPASIAFSWSPNGEHIAYLETTLESRGILGSLNIIDTASSDVRKITPEDTILAYFWSPDSQKIAYFTPGSPDSKDEQVRAQAQNNLRLTLHIMEIRTGVTHHSITFEPTIEFLNILPYFDQYQRSATIWSPDSTHLVYTTQSDENGASVWVVSKDGDTSSQIADGTLAFWSWR